MEAGNVTIPTQGTSTTLSFATVTLFVCAGFAVVAGCVSDLVSGNLGEDADICNRE